MDIFTAHEFIVPEVIGDFETAWHCVSACENPDSIRRILKSRHRNSNVEKDFNIPQIAACFSIGHRYFTEARNVALGVKPLLAFYGMLNIARGIILMRERSSRLDDLQKSHGVAFSSQATPSLGQQQVKTDRRRGTFLTFNDLTNRYDIIMPTSYVGVKADKAEELRNKQFSLEDLLCRLPELKYEIQLNLGLESRLLRGTTETKTEASSSYHYYSFFCHKQLDEDKGLIERLFPELDCCECSEEQVGPLHSVYRYRALGNPDGKGTKWLPCFTSINRQQYFVSRLNGCHLSEVAIQYLAAFLVSNIVRYSPALWEQTLCGRANTGYKPVLEKFYRLLDRKFPVLVTNEIMNKKFVL